MNETILIIDDSTYIVDGLVALLKRNKFSPIPTFGGEEGLKVLMTTTPDLILLDIMMEPMDGWETLEHIKSNPATKGIPVLMFSAKPLTPSEAKEHGINIDDYLIKPVDPARLIESINRIFSRKNDLNDETLIAKNAGTDNAVIDEYIRLRTTIDVDKNLLAALKRSTGSNIHGREVPVDDLAAMQKLEEKIRTDEVRLKEINDTIPKPS